MGLSKGTYELESSIYNGYFLTLCLFPCYTWDSVHPGYSKTMTSSLSPSFSFSLYLSLSLTLVL